MQEEWHEAAPLSWGHCERRERWKLSTLQERRLLSCHCIPGETSNLSYGPFEMELALSFQAKACWSLKCPIRDSRLTREARTISNSFSPFRFQSSRSSSQSSTSSRGTNGSIQEKRLLRWLNGSITQLIVTKLYSAKTSWRRRWKESESIVGTTGQLVILNCYKKATLNDFLLHLD